MWGHRDAGNGVHLPQLGQLRVMAGIEPPVPRHQVLCALRGALDAQGTGIDTVGALLIEDADLFCR